MSALESLRIRELRNADSSESATQSFWAEASQQGTPLLEAVPNDPELVLLTFLWRGNAQTRDVVLISPDLPSKTTRLEHLTLTDVWHYTCQVSTRARISYCFQINASRSRTVKTAGWSADGLVDPLNPRLFVIPQDNVNSESRPATFSFVDLPAAAPLPWLEPDSSYPSGMIAEFLIPAPRLAPCPWPGSVYGLQRRLWVYTPAGYAQRKDSSLRLLLFLDGWMYLNALATDQLLDYLITGHRISPVVAAFLDTPAPVREELQGSALHAAFIVKEVLPWLQLRYSLATQPNTVALIGCNQAAFAAAFTAITYPTSVGQLLLQSASISGPSPIRAGDREPEWLARRFTAAPRSFLHTVLQVGQMETDAPRPNEPSLLTANRHLRDVLRARNHPVIYSEFPGGHSLLSWRAELEAGLLALRDIKKLYHPDNPSPVR
ncbi:MAG: alpha/beta hydrolase-fold protein [Chloroflexi bacterium]|nr:alpha/beta hydrolase-fold protein [Chloroflexota bacterium]